MAIDHSKTNLCACVRPTVCVDRNGGLYLVTVRGIGTDRDDRVRTGEVSDRLDIAPSSVTEMFERLAAPGTCVLSGPYR